MNNNDNNLIKNPEPATLPSGLFDRIILAIQKEKELKQAKRILLGFVSLLIISITTIPFSFIFLLEEWQESGIFQFISIASDNFSSFFYFWQDLSLSILESFPIISTILFAVNLALVVFTIRLFLHRKSLLFKYLFYGR